MLISAREAAARLGAVGVTRRQARRVLAAGLAGRPVVTPSALLYDAERVAELAARPVVGDTDLDRACPWGLFVARRDVDLTLERQAQLESLADAWDFCPWTAVALRVRIGEHGYVPFVATVCGFVALGGELRDIRVHPERRHVLLLGEPGTWFDTFTSRRLLTGPGRPWVIRGCLPGQARPRSVVAAQRTSDGRGPTTVGESRP